MTFKFRTEIKPETNPDKISYSSNLMFLGSCFSDSIGEKLQNLKFNVLINPFGVLYNPFSILNLVEYCISEKELNEKDLDFYNEKWFSFSHHTSFSDISKTKCLDSINNNIRQTSYFLKKTNFLFLSFGTARIYINKKSGSVVANCHKIPAKEFNHKLLSVDEIVDKYNLLINKLLQLNANLKIVFTVSPIRHWKDGAQGNQLSKSILFVAIHEIIKNNPACTYFPAYEIMMDDLRDYRFYEADMLHPNQMAVDYIWDKFSEIYLDEKAKKLLPEIMNIINALNHKPFNTNTNEFKKFIENNLKIINSIKEKHPEIDFQKEINYFKSFV